MFAGVALGLGVGAPLVGGGRVPDPIAVVVLLGFPVARISVYLTRARRRWPVIVGSLIGIEGRAA